MEKGKYCLKNTSYWASTLRKQTTFATLCFLLLNSLTLLAQNTPLSNERFWIVKNPTDTLARDSLTIIPNSIRIISMSTDTPLDTTAYTVQNRWIIARQIPETRFPLSIKCRVLTTDLGKRFVRLDSAKRDPSIISPLEVAYATPSVGEQIFDKGLDYNGNYTQGFSLGNNQSLVVNQNFNLNLAGKLGDLEVLAAMTDNNLPIQAEGNTLELRQFDRIFIQLKKGQTSLIAGDYELPRPTGYFINYFKKLQGVTLAHTQAFKMPMAKSRYDKGVLKRPLLEFYTKGSAAIARGKFARMVLPVLEGNQGPYRLQPTEGFIQGAFFIILAATEKVFFDGKLLVRGEENDYAIDYNSGTIQFMPRRLVTKDSRIVIEFEYADQTYLRSTLALSNEFKINKLRLNLNYYAEQDSKNSSGTQSLDSLDLKLLRLAGNTPPSPLSIQTPDDGFRADRIQYELIDTLVQGKIYPSVLRYSTNPKLAKYTASFQPVGEGRGNYVQEITAANGRVYKWVAPDSATGLLRGSFEPIRQLVPPNKQEMLSLALDYAFSKTSRWQTEVSMSRYDANRFSTIGDSVNTGLAVFSNLQNRFEFGAKKNYTLQTDIKVEATQRNFRPLNPYRSAEFSRDWNLPISNTHFAGNSIGNLVARQMQAAEWMFIGNLNFERRNGYSTTYEYSRFNRASLYDGEKHFARLAINRKTWQFGAAWNTLHTEGGGERSKFERPNLELSKSLGEALKLSFNLERERNTRRDSQTDTVTRSSFAYDYWKLAMDYRPSLSDTAQRRQLGVGSFYAQRFDFLPIKNGFTALSKINEVGLQGFLGQTPQSTLTAQLTYRDMQVADTNATTLRTQTTYLGRVEYQFNIWKGALSSSSLYEIGSGQEQKIEYQYVRVRKGEGQYLWRNRNGDTIPQLDEFEIAPFPDQADYVRVSLFTNQFVRTNNVAFSQSLRFEPRRYFEKDSSSFISFVKRFSTASNLQISRRVKADMFSDKNTEGVSQWNPFEWAVPDAALIGLTIATRHSLYINRNHSVWDFELGQITHRNRFIVITGFEERGRDESFTRQRLNIGRALTFLNYASIGNLLNRSEAFRQRDYAVRQWKVEPQLTWLLGYDFRLSFEYKYRNGFNTLKPNGETLKTHSLATEATWNRSVNAQLRGRFAYIGIQYAGEKNTPIEFALLEGLQNGRNYVWSLSLDQSLSKNLLLSLSYDGRKTGDARVVHVGRCQVRAQF